MKIFLTLCMGLGLLASSAQTTFQKSFMSDAGSQGFFVLPTGDGYMIIGQGDNTDGNGYSGISFLKLNLQGDTVWTKIISAGPIGLITTCANTTSDGGYIIGGITSDQPVQYIDAFAAKTDANGNLEWLQTYGDGYDDRIQSVQEMTNGHFLVGGNMTGILLGLNSVLVMELDELGNIVVKKTYSVGTVNMGQTILQTEDGFAVCGSASDFGSGSYDMYIVRSSPNTDYDFKKVFGAGGEDRALDMQRTDDGGFIVVGYTNSYTTSTHVTMMKINAAGGVEWCTLYTGTGESIGTRVKITNDGGYIIAGYINILAQTDALLIKTDAYGNLEWASKYGTSLDGDMFNDVQQTSDGGFVATGYFADRTYIVKTDANGVSGCFENSLPLDDHTVLTNSTIGGVSFEPLYATPVVPADEYAYAPSVIDMCLTIGIEDLNEGTTSFIYPNPVYDDNFTVSAGIEFRGGVVEVINALGMVVNKETIYGDTHLMENDYPSGQYMVRLTSVDGRVEVHKMVVE